LVDEPLLPVEGVRFICWPSWISKLIGRPGIRAIWVILASLRYRPDLYMGYHLGPGACTALVAGKLMGRPICYQMTGGPVEIIGGGIYAVDGIGAALRHPSKVIEAMGLAVVRQFECVVVRGSKAKKFLASRGITRSTTVITGSVRSNQPESSGVRDIHLIFVGRLVPIKQVDQFIAIVHSVKRIMPDICAAIVGDGPLKADLQARTSQLGLSDNIAFLGQRKDVETFLARSKIFVLTSKSEGLSIAMAEAMTAGTVPVVPDIGELSDLVTDGVNGHLIEPGNIEDYASKAVSILLEEALWAKYSSKAIEAAKKHCGIEIVSEKWRMSLREVISQASRCRPEEIMKYELDELTRIKV